MGRLRDLCLLARQNLLLTVELMPPSTQLTQDSPASSKEKGLEMGQNTPGNEGLPCTEPRGSLWVRKTSSHRAAGESNKKVS